MNDSFVDLSHEIEDGLITYKGLPAPIICDYLSREEAKKHYGDGEEFQIAKIEMVSNTGTYIDCPFHRYENGKDFSQIAIGAFAELEGIVIKAPYTKNLIVGREFFEGHDLKNKAVLVHTGWSKFWKTDQYYENHPFLTPEAAEFLKDSGAKLVGIDSHNIDDSKTKKRPVHSLLLGAEILIVEHLCNLRALPSSGFYFSAIPPKFKGVGTFPVRAMAKITGSKQKNI